MTTPLARIHAITCAEVCTVAQTWLRSLPPGTTLAEAYALCPRGEWLLWLAARVEVDRKLIVKAACACAQVAVTEHWKGGPEPQAALDTAMAWARGEATNNQVSYAVAYAADAAYAAAAADAVYAAYAAARARNADIVREHLPLSVWPEEVRGEG